MSCDLDDIKTTIKEHPAETVAVAAVVTLIGTIFYYRTKQKNAEIRAAKQRAMRPPWWSYFIGHRRPVRYELDFAA